MAGKEDGLLGPDRWEKKAQRYFRSGREFSRALHGSWEGCFELFEQQRNRKALWGRFEEKHPENGHRDTGVVQGDREVEEDSHLAG